MNDNDEYQRKQINFALLLSTGAIISGPRGEDIRAGLFDAATRGATRLVQR
jgi:hypothetical protein